MNLLSNLSRRTFLSSQAAIAALAGIPVTLRAAYAKTEQPQRKGHVTARWETATADELEQFVGQRFSVQTHGDGHIAMRLSAIEAVDSGPDRPVSVTRREGVTAIFESPDIEPLVRDGHQTVRIRHARLGSADLFLGPVQKRDGSHVIELVLN